ncbi:MAG: GNAT family N-acetyltransferase [Bacilli bacterium]|nr:GNAT family N-acetyltransferase [Bacilli bacterium]
MIDAVFSSKLSDDERLIREEVFVKEQGFKEEFDEDDLICQHLVLYYNKIPIACGRIIEVDPETYKIGRVAVRKPYRGKKVGLNVMKFLETKIKTLGGRKALLCSQYDKMVFYERCGYHHTGDGEVVFDQDYPHVWMEKILVYPKKRRY